jgi:hypothetical protein
LRLESLPGSALRLLAPIEVPVDQWADDGMFTAHWDAVKLHADSYSAEDAVAKLGEEIARFHAKMAHLEREGKLYGVLMDEWKALNAVVERTAA